jgi:hypothetical protein
MVLVGIAMQLKYTALFEGVFSWCRAVAGLVEDQPADRPPGRRRRALGGHRPGADPGGALAYYAWIGETPAFVYANFLSIGARSNASPDELLHRLAKAWKALHLPVWPLC